MYVHIDRKLYRDDQSITTIPIPNGKVRYKIGRSLAQYTPVLELPSPSLDISDHGQYGLPNGAQTSLVHREEEILALMANAAHRGNDDGRSYTERLDNLVLR